MGEAGGYGQPVILLYNDIVSRVGGGGGGLPGKKVGEARRLNQISLVPRVSSLTTPRETGNEVGAKFE